MPLRCVFGWQKPCYLLGEGYVKTFKELMEDTEWDKYGVGKYEKCQDCMVHCGFEGTSVIELYQAPAQADPARRPRREDPRPLRQGYRHLEAASRRIRVLKTCRIKAG